MAGEQYNVTKVIRNGDEYYFPGAGKIISKKIFGDGSDGDCVIEYDDSVKGNVFMEAKEYNFCNFTVCPNVKLRFCGNGIPILRVKECFLNCGTIWLRNPLMNCDAQYAEPYTHFVLTAEKNSYASCVQRLFNCLSCECLKNAQASGGGNYGTSSYSVYMNGAKGGSFYTPAVRESCTYSGCTAYTGNPGTSTNYAAGGGGGGGMVCTASGCPSCNGGDGGNANGYIGGNGGCGAFGSSGGGGGGFGLCGGGNGGCGHYGGRGGNSIYGNGGNGGCSTRGSASGGTVGSQGGCSYYGNGGVGGSAQGYLGQGGTGGCSVFGNGGSGGNGCCYADGGGGGSSVFGNGGSAHCNYRCGCGMVGYVSRGGTYDTGFFAKNLCNAGNICGHGNASCGGGGGARGAKIYMVYQAFSSTGTITCTGNGCTNGALIQCQI